jgi:hypothetical protein
VIHMETLTDKDINQAAASIAKIINAIKVAKK